MGTSPVRSLLKIALAAITTLVCRRGVLTLPCRVSSISEDRQRSDDAYRYLVAGNRATASSLHSGRHFFVDPARGRRSMGLREIFAAPFDIRCSGVYI